MMFLLEGAKDGQMFAEAIEAECLDAATALAIDRLREAWGEEGEELDDFGDAAALRQYDTADFARDAAEELLAACRSMLPAGVCLTNSNIRDDFVVPIDVTMGDLRRLAAVIAKASGQ